MTRHAPGCTSRCVWCGGRCSPLEPPGRGCHDRRVTRHTSARLFVALDPPADVATQLAGWARRGLRAPVRLLHPDTLHATILFLGSRPVGEIDDIGAALGRACAAVSPIARLEVGAPLWLPPRRPRALAVELHDDPAGSLHALHAAVADELAAVCEADEEQSAAGRRSQQRFRPHITLARLHPRDAPRERALPPTPALAFGADRLTLYRSWLTPTNAEYEALESHSLAAL